MDSSLHHDPYIADEDVSAEQELDMALRFRDDRWRRAGASEEELVALEAEFGAMDPDHQLAETSNIDSVSDMALSEELDARRQADPELVAGSVKSVLDEVGSDPVRARAAIIAEESKDKPRSTLVTQLQAIVDAAPPSEPPVGADGVKAPPPANPASGAQTGA